MKVRVDVQCNENEFARHTNHHPHPPYSAHSTQQPASSLAPGPNQHLPSSILGLVLIILILDNSAALPADAAALKDLRVTMEQHLELVLADDPALARRCGLHQLDVLPLELKQLRGHLLNRLWRLARLGAAPDRHLEVAFMTSASSWRFSGARCINLLSIVCSLTNR